MPSIAEAVAKNQRRITAGGPTGTGVGPMTPEQPLVLPPATPQLDMPYGGGLPQRGTFPASSILAADLNDSNRAYRGPSTRSAAFPYPSTPAKQITKTTIEEVTSSTAVSVTSLLIEVSGAPTPSQEVLNFIALSGMSITYDAVGGVYFASAASGDGLAHGDPIWDVDSAVAFWRDDFATGTATATTGGNSTVGELKWDLAGISSGSSFSKIPGGGAWPHQGWLHIISGTTKNNAGVLVWPNAGVSGAGNIQSAMPLFDYPGWKMVWVFGSFSQRITSTTSPFPLAGKSLYLGLCGARGATTWYPGNSSGNSVRPPLFYGLRFDTDTNSPSIGDSTFVFEAVANPSYTSSQARNNTQGTTFNTGITPTEFVTYRFEMTYLASGTLVMSLYGSDGSSATTTFSSLPTASSNSTNSQAITMARGNGLGEIIYSGAASAGTSNDVWAIGSIVAITNAPALESYYNGKFTLFGANAAGTYTFALAGGTNSLSSSGVTITGYPGVVPCFIFGNDNSVSSPVSAQMGVDFFALVWNSGIATSPLALKQASGRWTTGS